MEEDDESTDDNYEDDSDSDYDDDDGDSSDSSEEESSDEDELESYAGDKTQRVVLVSGKGGKKLRGFSLVRGLSDGRIPKYIPDKAGRAVGAWAAKGTMKYAAYLGEEGGLAAAKENVDKVKHQRNVWSASSAGMSPPLYTISIEKHMEFAFVYFQVVNW